MNRRKFLEMSALSGAGVVIVPTRAKNLALLQADEKANTMPVRKLGNTGIRVGIDDGLLNIPFTVLRFETAVTDNLGMDVRETSQGAHFTDRQKTQIRGVARGKRVLIRGIVARGPDGVERNLRSPLEVLIN